MFSRFTVFLTFAATLSILGPIALGDALHAAEKPIIDRVILTPKKKKPPVVDRIILKRKKPTPPAQSQSGIELLTPTEDYLVEETLEPEGIVIDDVAPPAVGPVGIVMHLAILAGDRDLPQLGAGYWFNDSWGLTFLNGLGWTREEGPIASPAGSRRVSALTYAWMPELSVAYSPLMRTNLRLIVEAGGGAAFSKAARQEGLKPAYHAFLGPAIQWHILRPFSLQATQRLELNTAPKPVRYDLGLSTQITASWWFE